jgi:antitoxin YefM
LTGNPALARFRKQGDPVTGTPTTVVADAARDDPVKFMDEVGATRPYVIMLRQNATPVVMMSYQEFRSIQETIHRMGNPANARELLDSIAELGAGRFHSEER